MELVGVLIVDFVHGGWLRAQSRHFAVESVGEETVKATLSLVIDGSDCPTFQIAFNSLT